LEIKDWTQNPIILCGHRKSGTTLLLNLFDSYRHLSVFPSDSGFWYAYYPTYDSDQYSIEQKMQRVIDVLYCNVRDDLEALEAYKSSDWTFPMDTLVSAFREAAMNTDGSASALLSSAMASFHEVVLEPKGIEPSGFLEKTTSTEIYAMQVYKWYPNAKMIHLVRDPRDNFASLKSGWKARYQHLNDSIERLLQSMIDRGLLGLKLARLNREIFGENRYKVVRYEDLTANPQSVMMELCRFIELPYDPILLEPTFLGMPWRGNNFDGLKFDAPSTANVDRWKERITDHEAALIEFYGAEEMEHWGYKPAFSTSSRVQASLDHYQWYNFQQIFSVANKADTYNREEETQEKT
jgi:hypothetical protein